MCLLSSSLQWLAIVSFLCHLWPFSRLVQNNGKNYIHRQRWGEHGKQGTSGLPKYSVFRQTGGDIYLRFRFLPRDAMHPRH